MEGLIIFIFHISLNIHLRLSPHSKIILNELISAFEHLLQNAAWPIVSLKSDVNIHILNPSIQLAFLPFSAVAVGVDTDEGNLEGHSDLLYFMGRPPNIVC